VSISPRHAIGIDIGGTKIGIALVDARGVVLGRTLLPTQAELGFGRAVDRMEDAIAGLLTELRLTGIDGIGVGCAGPVDSARGLINNPYTLTGWNQCDIVTPLSDRFSVPVRLENDADAAAIGECARGAGRNASPVVMLTFGTGVGGAAVVNGDVYRGARGEHPELGHIPVCSGTGSSCYCGISGCLESVASGTAITLAGKEEGFVDARAVFDGTQDGDARAMRIVQRVTDAACAAAWTLCHTFLPERLILGGGIMDEHFDRFAVAVQAHLSNATQFTPDHVQIVRAELGNEAGMVGAGIIGLRISQVRV
jgi:glucokinase